MGGGLPNFSYGIDFHLELEFIRDLSKTQIGEEYGPWVPFIGTMFLFIFVSIYEEDTHTNEKYSTPNKQHSIKL